MALAAVALRMYGIGDKSIWRDEAWSWRAASLSFGDMVDWAAADRHPPLCSAVLHVFAGVLGDREMMPRLPSALASAESDGSPVVCSLTNRRAAARSGSGWPVGRPIRRTSNLGKKPVCVSARGM